MRSYSRADRPGGQSVGAVSEGFVLLRRGAVVLPELEAFELVSYSDYLIL